MALEGIHDAFIVDLGLPDLDGLDLIARCRRKAIRPRFLSCPLGVLWTSVFADWSRAETTTSRSHSLFRNSRKT